MEQPLTSQRDQQTILVVDNNALVRAVIVAILKRSGFATVEAANGQQGLDGFAQDPERIDFVLSDIAMPDMTGPEMVERILRFRPSVGFMFMSGTGSTNSMPGGLRARVLSKPFTSKELLPRIEEYLGDAVSRAASAG